MYKKVKQALLELAEQSRPHSRLPSRKALCDRYQVARSTVDRAVNELLEDGTLYSLKGSGTYVADHGTNGLALPHEGVSAAVLLPSILHDTYPGILRGIEDEMQLCGASVTLCNTDSDFDKQESYIQRLIRSRVSGIIMIPTVNEDAGRNQRLSELLRAAQLPVVFCNRRVPGIPMPLVASNDFFGGFLAASHLIERGYRRIAWLSSRPYPVSEARFQGYQAAHWAAGLEPVEALECVVDAVNEPATGEAGMRRLLKLEPDAVFCFNDRLAFGALDAIKDAGLVCGRDIALMGYDNRPLCEVLRPKLSSVSYNEYENGRLAARMLLESILHPDKKQPALTVTRPRLFVRDSTPQKGIHGETP